MERSLHRENTWPLPANRVMGLETEFGILSVGGTNGLNSSPSHTAALMVDAYARQGKAATPNHVVRWDYRGEDPLNDARGYRITRAQADPTQLTDVDASAGLFRSTRLISQVARPTNLAGVPGKSAHDDLALNAVLKNGARFYVDHAHPEYSSPEVGNPREAVLWDRAGEALAVEAMRLASEEVLPSRDGAGIVLYKNNVDGKGAAYGAHENYLVRRSVDFTDIIRYLTPFFVTRQILAGSGRVGLGPHSEYPGFQISQRADYVENDVGLETTFNRPIINTRDEPHATPTRWRRLHVIGGDANQFDVSNLLKVGTTSLVLWLLEQGDIPMELDSLLIDEPVPATWEISHDPSLRVGIEMHDGTTRTAVEIQQVYLDVVRSALHSQFGADLGFDATEVIELWQEVLDNFRTDFTANAPLVEWVAKYLTLDQYRQKLGVGWEAPEVKSLDLQWHDLRPEKSIVARLKAAGQVRQLFSDDEVQWALTHAPRSTRAYFRGALIEKFGRNVFAAGWDGVTVDLPGFDNLVRIATWEPTEFAAASMGMIVDEAQSIHDVLAALGAQK